MAHTDWRLKGQWLKNCNCAFGCPCDFNARPTHEVCHGLVAMHIEQGHFGKVKVDGLNWVVMVDFPGPLHEGNGKIQAIVDERATAEQREALFGIFSGQNSEPGTIFNIFSLIVTKMHDPIFAPIEFSFDLAKRRAHISAKGALVTEVEVRLSRHHRTSDRWTTTAGRGRSSGFRVCEASCLPRSICPIHLQSDPFL